VLTSAIQEVVRSGSLEAWIRLLVLPGCVLGTHGVTVGAGPGLATRKSHRMIIRRAGKWEAGHYVQLLEELLSAEGSTRLPPVALESACRDRARRLVGEGRFSAAIKVLHAAPLAPATPETVRAVQDLFPEGPAIPHVEGDGPCMQVGKEELLAALRRMNMGTTPRQDGLRVRHLVDAMGPPACGMGSVVVDALVELVNATLRGQVPAAIRPFFAGALVLKS
jgi:hypothetical protein